MQEHSLHQEGSDLGGSPKGGEGNPSGQTPMGTPFLPQQVEADYRDETIQSFAQNILRLGSECRALADENKTLKTEVENSNRINTELLLLSNKQASEVRRLKAEVERLTVAADWKTPARKIQALEAENDLLRKAGDAMADELQMLEEVIRFKRHQTTMDCRKENPRVKAWNAAKEGKPSV